MPIIRIYIPLILKTEATDKLLELLASMNDMGMWVALYQRDKWTDVDYESIKTDARKFYYN